MLSINVVDAIIQPPKSINLEHHSGNHAQVCRYEMTYPPNHPDNNVHKFQLC
jgi:hypothetical protein